MASQQGSNIAVELCAPRVGGPVTPTSSAARQPPDGFIAIETACAFPGHIGKFYLRESEDAVPTVGAWIENLNTNRAGYAHGGYLLAFADFVLTSVVGGMTVNLSADFLRSAPAGKWIEAQVQVRKRTKYTIFADAIVTCEGRDVARLSGVFRPLARDDQK